MVGAPGQMQMTHVAPEQAQVSVTIPPGVYGGTTMATTTPDGQTINFTCPPGAQPGQTIVLAYTPVDPAVMQQREYG